MARRQGRGRRQVVRAEISRLSQQEVIDLFAQTQWPGAYAQVYTTGGRSTEKIPNNYAAFAETAYCSSSVVGAVMRVRRDIFRQARFTWREITEDGTGTLMHDEALAVLERPWPNGTTGELLTKMITDVDLSGNSFIINEGVRLRWRRPDWMYLVLSGDPNVDVDVDVIGYVYTPGGCDIRDGTPYLPENVCHWSPIPAWGAQYIGQSWMVSALKDIQADKAATDHKLSFFRNGATLGPIFTLPPTMTPEQFHKFRVANDEAHVGSDNAYKPLYIGGGATVTMSSSTFQQLELKATQGAGETRIASLAGVHPAIAGLSEGLSGSSLNAGNFTAARRITSDLTMMPLWQDACNALSTFVEVPDGYELWIRESAIPFLREDAKDAAEIASVVAQIVTSLVREGYEPESAQRYAITRNPMDLKHSGLMSVQLQPPGLETGMEPVDAEVVDEPVDFGALRADPYGPEGILERRYYGSIAGERVPLGHEGGGRFRKLTDQITDLLEKWVKGDGPDDPLDPLTDDQLRKVARDKGLLAPRQRASRNALKVLLYKDAKGARESTKDAAPPKPDSQDEGARVRELLADYPAPRLRKIATALSVQLAPGTNSKRAITDAIVHDMAQSRLREADSAGRRHSAERLIREAVAETEASTGPGDVKAMAGKLHGLRGETEGRIIRELATDQGLHSRKLHDLAEELEIDVPADMRAKTSLQLRIAEAVSKMDKPLPSTVALSEDPDVRAVQVENRVRVAYRLAKKRSDGDWVALADIRDEIGEDLSRQEIDDALRRLEHQDGVNIVPQSNQKALTQADRDSAVQIGGQDKHFITIDDPSMRPLPANADPDIHGPLTPAKKEAPAPRTPGGTSGRKKAAAVSDLSVGDRILVEVDSAARWDVVPPQRVGKSHLHQPPVELTITEISNLKGGRRGIYGTLPDGRRKLFHGDGNGFRRDEQVLKVGGAVPAPTSEPPDLDTIRQLGDPESMRDALDLRKVDDLKAMLRDQKLPVSGRKRDLVDRLVEHLGTPEAPKTPKVRPSGLPTDRRPDSSDFEDLAERVFRLRTQDQVYELLQDLNKTELTKLARKFPGEVGINPSGYMTDRRSGLRLPDEEMTLDELRRWLAQQIKPAPFSTSRSRSWDVDEEADEPLVDRTGDEEVRSGPDDVLDLIIRTGLDESLAHDDLDFLYEAMRGVSVDDADYDLLCEAMRAAGADITPGREQLHHYWTRGEGLAKWKFSPKPWTTLVGLLTKHVGPLKAKVFASRWFIEVFGYAAGSDKNRVAHGKPPRGKRVGPG